ncbi:MAG: PspA-associated protein PspAB [Brevibacterium yomogidense]
MGFFDALFGRTKPKEPNLDDLFAVPSAALTLEARSGITPTGVGAVAFREVEGGAFDRAEQEARALISADPNTDVTQVNDGYGYTWQVVEQQAASTSDLVTSLHAVNAALEAQGFGPMLLCSNVYFRAPDGRTIAVVYLYKRGTFYPFVQRAKHQRDSAFEIQLRSVLDEDLPVEEDMTKWSPLWDAPGMDR